MIHQLIDETKFTRQKLDLRCVITFFELKNQYLRSNIYTNIWKISFLVHLLQNDKRIMQW